VTNPCKKGTYGVFGTYLGYKKVVFTCLSTSLPPLHCVTVHRATRVPVESMSACPIPEITKKRANAPSQVHL
jgi:hypothetical protein